MEGLISDAKNTLREIANAPSRADVEQIIKYEFIDVDWDAFPSQRQLLELAMEEFPNQQARLGSILASDDVEAEKEFIHEIAKVIWRGGVEESDNNEVQDKEEDADGIESMSCSESESVKESMSDGEIERFEQTAAIPTNEFNKALLAKLYEKAMVQSSDSEAQNTPVGQFHRPKP